MYCDGQITLYLHIYQRQKRICVLCVKTQQKCISFSYYDDLRYKKTITLTHNHNYMMGTITFKIHPITPISSRNMLAIIFKSIFILFFFFLHIFFLNISCMASFSGEMVIYSYERERRNTELCKPKNHNFAMPKHINVIHDWLALVVRQLFIHFSYDFLVLPVKKSDMSVKYKRLFNPTHHKHEPQSSLAQLCIKMLI